jgi:hypothetical protein
VTDCPCTDRDRDRRAWHRYRGTPACEAARAQRRDRLAGEPEDRWVPGTSVLVPETDEL